MVDKFASESQIYLEEKDSYLLYVSQQSYVRSSTSIKWKDTYDFMRLLKDTLNSKPFLAALLALITAQSQPHNLFLKAYKFMNPWKL